VKDVQLETEFKTAVIYEGFQSVYHDEVNIMAANETRIVNVELFRGKMSGNIKLEVQL